MNSIKLESELRRKHRKIKEGISVKPQRTGMAPFYAVSPRIIKALTECPSLYLHGEMKLTQGQVFQAGASST